MKWEGGRICCQIIMFCNKWMSDPGLWLLFLVVISHWLGAPGHQLTLSGLFFFRLLPRSGHRRLINKIFKHVTKHNSLVSPKPRVWTRRCILPPIDLTFRKHHFQMPKTLWSFKDFRPKIAKNFWENLTIFWTKLSEKV